MLVDLVVCWPRRQAHPVRLVRAVPAQILIGDRAIITAGLAVVAALADCVFHHQDRDRLARHIR